MDVRTSPVRTARGRSQAGSSRRSWLVCGVLGAYALAATITLVVFHRRIRTLEQHAERSEADRVAQRRAAEDGKSEVHELRREGRQSPEQPRADASPSPRTEEPAAPRAPKDASNDPASSAASAPAGVAARARSLFERYFAAEQAGDGDAASAAQDELCVLLRQDAEAHEALMALLQDADSDERVYELIGFLTRNPFARSLRHMRVTERIMAMAWEIVRGAGSAEKRAAAAEVLLEYGGDDAGREHAPALVELWNRESDPAVRDALFEQLLQRGPYPLPAEGTGAVVRELRSRAQAGDWDAGALLSCWSEDPNDFQLLANAVRTVPDGEARQDLLNALQSDRAITRGRGRETRALLVEVLEDEKCTLRDMAYDFLRDSWLPWDEATAAAVRRYEAQMQEK